MAYKCAKCKCKFRNKWEQVIHFCSVAATHTEPDPDFIIIGLDDPAILHNTIKDAVGE